MRVASLSACLSCFVYRRSLVAASVSTWTESVQVGYPAYPLKEDSDLCHKCPLNGRRLPEDDAPGDDKSNFSSRV
jgi:hypothetical protein